MPNRFFGGGGSSHARTGRAGGGGGGGGPAIAFSRTLQYVDGTNRGTDGSADAVFTTPSVQFTSPNPVIIGIAAMKSTGAVNFPSITGPAGVTFTRLFDWIRGGLDAGTAGSRRCFYFLAKPSVPGLGALTVTFTQQVIETFHIHAVELSGSGVDTEDPVVQLQGSSGDTFATSTAVDMSPFNNANNGTLLMGFHGAAETVTPESGWTLVGDTNAETTGFHSLVSTASDTTPTATYATSSHNTFAAFEVGRRSSQTTNIYRATLRGKGSTGSATSVTTGQLWLRANHHAIVYCRNVATTPATITPSGTGLTFTQIRSVVHPSNTRFTAWHVLVGSTDFVGTITFTADGGTAQNPWGYVILLGGGGLLGGTNGSAAFIQSATGTAALATSLSVPLSAFAQTSNRTVMALNFGNNTTTVTMDTTPAGWTFIDSIVPSGQTVHASTVNEADTSPTHTFSSAINASGIAFEYQAR